MSNASLFSSVAKQYASFRPGYPPELFAWLAQQAMAREAVWDCGCGSGQASVPLAGYFARVFATDVSAEQVAQARPHPQVSYSVAAAERSGLPDDSMDLVTVAQALHWFDFEAFYAEVRRVARTGATLAAWTYPRPQFVDASLDRCFEDFYRDVVGPYWPAERRHVDAHYATLPFPFEKLAHPGFELSFDWDLPQLLGYVSSWSATVRYRQQLGRDPVPLLGESLAPLWPAGRAAARLRMPIVLLAGRIR